MIALEKVSTWMQMTVGKSRCCHGKDSVQFPGQASGWWNPLGFALAVPERGVDGDTGSRGASSLFVIPLASHTQAFSLLVEASDMARLQEDTPAALWRWSLIGIGGIVNKPVG